MNLGVKKWGIEIFTFKHDFWTFQEIVKHNIWIIKLEPLGASSFNSVYYLVEVILHDEELCYSKKFFVASLLLQNITVVRLSALSKI